MISILIPVKNEGRYIDQCLSNIFSQQIDEKFEVVIVDSGSTDNTMELIKKYKINLIEIPSTEYHHAKTRNLLASKANGEFLIFTVGDAIPYNNNWLKELIDPLKENKTVAAVFSRQIPREDANPIDSHIIKTSFPPFRIEKNINFLYNDDHKLHWDNFIFFSDVSAAYRKEIWSKYRFNEQLKYGEDQDIAKRMLLDGYTVIYNPTSIIIHSHNESSKKVFRRNVEIAHAFKDISATKARLVTLPLALLIHGKSFYSDMKKLNINRPFYWTLKSIAQAFFTGLGRFVGYHYHKFPQILKTRVKLLP